MLFKKIFIFLLLEILFSIRSEPVFAATFTFTDAPSSMNENDSFSVNITLSVSGSAGKTYYIRGAFSHSDSPTSYFGYTKNNQGDWYNGSPFDKTQYYKISMDSSGQWIGIVDVKLDTSDSAYKGTGTYNLKLGRYTAGGSSQTPTWCDKESTPCSVASIVVVAPTPTFTPTSTSISTPTPKDTTIPTKIPTHTKTPVPVQKETNSPSSVSTTKPVLKNTPIPTKKDLIPTSVLGSNVNALIATKKEEKKESIEKDESQTEGSVLSKIFIFAGGILLISSGIIFVRSYMKRRNSEDI